MSARIFRQLALFLFLVGAGCGNAPTAVSCADNHAGCLCKNDSICGGENPRCDTRTGRCVPCLPLNDNCATGSRCLKDGNNYVCGMGCLSTADCPKVAGVQQQCCDKVCIDTNKSDTNCGACGNACKAPPNANVACVGGGCNLMGCSEGYDNCDGKMDNGCETHTAVDVAHCGSCATPCVVGQNATPSCSAGKCGGACVQGYQDCDANLANGCETDSANDSKNCGACGKVCGPLPNSPMSVCRGGLCTASACTGWFGDCNKDSVDGCESDTQIDVKNCGGCGIACPAAANGTPGCNFGTCVISRCNAGFGDCDRDLKNGCEKSTSADVRNCGTCGTVCAAQNAIMDCVAGACEVSACNPGFTDCDKDARNGCEANTNSDILNCNACGMKCPVPANADVSCKLGVCGVGACRAGYADCDKDPMTGCEADINSLQNCGGCNIMCGQFANASNQCLGGKCTIKTCNQGFENCDNNAANGCEKNLQTDPANCGICGVTCNYRNAAGACAMAKCAMGACNLGWADCDKMDGNGCEQDVSADVKNCGGCGVVCPQNAPNCVGAKCTNSVHNSLAWQGYNQFGAWGCFASAGAGYPDDLDWMELSYYGHTWKSCMLEASKRGAMVMAPSTADWDYPGWYGHRNGADAVIGEWGRYNAQAIVSQQTCVITRLRNIQGRNGVLAKSMMYDGSSWEYEDYGSKYFYECQELASKAGASIISPWTLGLGNGDDYWIGMIDVCAMSCWTAGGGNDFQCEEPYDPDIGSRHKCMVGYMNN